MLQDCTVRSAGTKWFPSCLVGPALLNKKRGCGSENINKSSAANIRASGGRTYFRNDHVMCSGTCIGLPNPTKFYDIGCQGIGIVAAGWCLICSQEDQPCCGAGMHDLAAQKVNGIRKKCSGTLRILFVLKCLLIEKINSISEAGRYHTWSRGPTCQADDKSRSAVYSLCSFIRISKVFLFLGHEKTCSKPPTWGC